MIKSGRKLLTTILIFMLMITILSLDSSTKKVQAEGTTMKVDDYVQFGKYNGKPILWRVINVDEDGSPMLFSSKILCLKAFDVAEGRDGSVQTDRQYWGSNKWDNSNIREWLNSDKKIVKYSTFPPSIDAVDYENSNSSYNNEEGFLYNFTETEKSAIKPVTRKVILSEVDKDERDGGTEAFKWEPVHSINSSDFKVDINALLKNYDTTAYYKNVTDKVHLLSYKEFVQYILNRGIDYIWKKATLELEAENQDKSGDGYYFIEDYFLDTPVKEFDELFGHNNFGVATVNDSIQSGIHRSNPDSKFGIVPALTLKSGVFKTGSGTENDPYIPDTENNYLVKEQTLVMNSGNIADLKNYLDLSEINLTWKSNNEDVVKVSNGVVTAVGNGTAVISAAGQDGKEYGVFTINVVLNSVNSSDLGTIRLGGKDRYETAVTISQAGWKGTSKYVVLASGNDFPDALSAAPLAKQYSSPILLTDKNSLSQDVIDELKRLQVNHIFIIGGLGSVSQSVENQINSMGIETERFGGKDRYETSVKVAEKLGVVSGEMILTNGYEFADALSASSIAAKKGMPILITDKNNLPNSVSNFLAKTSFSKAYVLGDTDLVSNSVANTFPDYERIVGSNKYERNINIIKRFEKDIDFKNICIASGKDFPDALAGSALATMVSSAIVLVDDNDIEDITQKYTNEKKIQVNNVYVFGLEGSLKDETINTILDKTKK